MSDTQPMRPCPSHQLRSYTATKRHTRRAVRRAVRRFLRSGVPQSVTVTFFTTPRAFRRLYGDVQCPASA